MSNHMDAMAQDQIEGALSENEQLRREIESLRQNAARYEKLRGWMSSNAPEGWGQIQRLAAVACWDAFDALLDEMPACNVGLMQYARIAPTAPAEPSERLLEGQAQHLIGALVAAGMLSKEMPAEKCLKLWDVVRRQLKCVNREGARTAAAPQAEPLTDDQIDQIGHNWGAPIKVLSHDFGGKAIEGREFTLHRFRCAVRDAFKVAGTTPTAPAAPQAAPTAPAEPVKLVPYEPTSEMLIAAREIDPALPIEHVRRLWWLLWRAAPPAEPQPVTDKLRRFLDAAAGDGLELDGVDAADLFLELFPDAFSDTGTAPKGAAS